MSKESKQPINPETINKGGAEKAELSYAEKLEMRANDIIDKFIKAEFNYATILPNNGVITNNRTVIFYKYDENATQRFEKDEKLRFKVAIREKDEEGKDKIAVNQSGIKSYVTKKKLDYKYRFDTAGNKIRSNNPELMEELKPVQMYFLATDPEVKQALIDDLRRGVKDHKPVADGTNAFIKEIGFVLKPAE